VPAQQRLRPHKEARPAGTGQHAADRGEQRPVGGLQPESWDLAAQDGELVAEHQDLKIPGGVTADHQPEQLDGTAQLLLALDGQTVTIRAVSCGRPTATT
jgi:hypothetical protein